MNHEFTVEEIKDAARTARVHCPGFNEEKFESLMELGRRVAESGYLEAVQGLVRLEEEKGISCTEALDACEQLTKQKTKLEHEIPVFQLQRPKPTTVSLCLSISCQSTSEKQQSTHGKNQTCQRQLRFQILQTLQGTCPSSLTS